MVPPPSVPKAPAPVSGKEGGALRIVVGLVLLGPAVLVALISLVIPTAQTILRSFQRGGPALLRSEGEDADYVGFDNYVHLFGDDQVWKALAFTLALAIIPLVAAVVVAPLLAGALDQAGTWPRRIGRVLMSVPMVVFSPVAFSVGWALGMRDGGLETAFGELTSPGSARVAVVVISGLATFGAVCGLALLGYLAVLRGRGQGRRVLPAAFAVGTIAALATFAVSLQAFSFVQTLTRGGPARSTQTLSLLQFNRSFSQFESGSGAAVATVTGVIIGVLGIAATLIAIIAALRIDLSPPDRAAAVSDDPAGPVVRPGNPVRTLVAAAALLAVLAVVLIGAWPWLSALFSSPGPGASMDTGTYVNTWVPSLLGALVSVGTAFLAALGIGGLRPMGRHSEWLLLPFAPWLLVGIGPLSFTSWENTRSLKLIDTFAGQITPILISVPVLVVLTLFCRGRAPQWQAQMASGVPAAAGFVRVVVLPALPLAAFLGGAVVLINAQSLLWPLVVSPAQKNPAAPVVLLREMSQFGQFEGSVGFVTPLAVVVVALLALAALQIGYLDRLAITTDRPAKTPAPGMSIPHTGANPPGAPSPSGPAPQSKPRPD